MLFEKVLSELKRSWQEYSIVKNNFVFCLHYSVTVTILIFVSVLASIPTNSFIPIKCSSDNSTPTEYFIQNKEELNNGDISEFFNVDANYKCHVSGAWYVCSTDICVALMFITQALLLYVPKFMWDLAEKGRLKKCVTSLNCPNKTKKSSMLLLAESFACRDVVDRLYFLLSFLSELVLAFIDVVNVTWLDSYFKIPPCNSLVRVIEIDKEWNSPLKFDRYCDKIQMLSTKLTPCEIFEYRLQGITRGGMAFAQIPLPIIFEKIFIFFKYWYIFLAMLTSIVLIYRLVQFFAPLLRLEILRWKAPNVTDTELDVVLRGNRVADWYFLYLLSKNLDSETFEKLIVYIAKSKASADVLDDDTDL